MPLDIAIKKRLLVEGIALIQLLRRSPSSVWDVEEELGIPRREFYRYLQALKLAGAPLTSRRRRRDSRVLYSLPKWWP